MTPVLNTKDRSAIFEGIKKSACCTTNAVLFFYFGHWFSDNSRLPADPVWVHITITMLCELGSMDRLNEKIILRTAGTTIGAVSGAVMSFSGLTDPMRLVIFFTWIAALGVIEAKDPQRSYTWTIGTVTFGICTYLGRMGKAWTPWKRWASIMLGTLITCVYQLLLPMFGVYSGKRASTELCEATKVIWNNTIAMVEDAIENAQDPKAAERRAEKEASIMGSLSAYPANWKYYSWSRTWLNLAPKPLPMDIAQKLLRNALRKLFVSGSSAARALHSSMSSSCPEAYAKLRIELHNFGLSVPKAISMICIEDFPSDAILASEELSKAIQSAERAGNILPQLGIVHRCFTATLLVDMLAVVIDLIGALDVAESKAASLLSKCNVLASDFNRTVEIESAKGAVTAIPFECDETLIGG